MSSKNNLQGSTETLKRCAKINENIEIKCNLLKDFKNQVSQFDFLTQKEEPNKNFGILDEVITLMNKSNKKIYYLKAIDKKDIINKSYQSFLNAIYKLNNQNKNLNIYDYIINLETQWENNEKLFLVFEAVKKYSLLDNLIKNNSDNLTEENILVIFRHILESVNILHENKIFGCNLTLDSFIYDTESKTIKLTDLGFSKLFKSQKNYNDNKLKNGFEFNEYTPPELINKMNDQLNISIQEKMKNMHYDIWQLGILFYKIATFGKSPFENAKDEELKERILDRNLEYFGLNKLSPRIIQIIDKMLQRVPTERYSIKQLLNLEYFRMSYRIPSLIIINYKNENKTINMEIVNKEKAKIGDVKMDMSTLLNNMEAKKSYNDKEEEKNKDEDNTNNKNLLNNIYVQGNLINSKGLINQEIYPDGTVLHSFKNKFLNKFHSVDNDLIINLSNKLALLEKEYKNIDEIKRAIYNITNYITEKIKEKNINDNKEIESLIEKYKERNWSKTEMKDLYNEILKNKENYLDDKVKLLISNLLFEIKNLDINLNHEKSLNKMLNDEKKDLERQSADLKSEYQEKIEFYEKKIELLEDVIFNVENTNLNKTEIINNNKLLYQALTNSMKNFTDINIKLRENLEENLLKFKDNKKSWLEDIIKAKQSFRNEIAYFMNKSIEQPKTIVFEKKDNKEILSKNKKDEKIDELSKKIVELNNLINEQKLLIDQNTSLIKSLKEEIQLKDKKIDELNKLIN